MYIYIFFKVLTCNFLDFVFSYLNPNGGVEIQNKIKKFEHKSFSINIFTNPTHHCLQPLTDGQTEKLYSLKQYNCLYIDIQSDNWTQLLAPAKCTV